MIEIDPRLVDDALEMSKQMHPRGTAAILAIEVQNLREERDKFYMDYRMKAVEGQLAQLVEIERLRKLLLTVREIIESISKEELFPIDQKKLLNDIVTTIDIFECNK